MQSATTWLGLCALHYGRLGLLMSSLVLGCQSPRVPQAMACPQTPAQLANDSRNCGACGHDCQGGACNGGVCRPTLMARLSDARNLRSAGNELVAVTSHGIFTTKKGDDAFVQIWNGAVPNVTTDRNRVYWVWNGAWEYRLDSRTISPLKANVGTTWQEDVFVGEGRLFWLDKSVQAISLGSGGAAKVVVRPQPGAWIHHFVLAPPLIVWEEVSSVPNPPRDIFRKRDLSGTVETELSAPPGLRCPALVANGKTLYILSAPAADSSFESAIFELSLDSGVARQLVSLGRRPRPSSGACVSGALWADDKTIIGVIDNELFLVDLLTHSKHALAEDVAASGLAVDDSFAYYVGKAGIMRWRR
jgi:hypothetical protein